MILAIVGDRHYNDWNRFCEKLFLWCYHNGIPNRVISGDAAGADALAKKWSAIYGIDFESFEAKWHLYGRAAGPKRNKIVIAAATHVVAFPLPTSVGTWISINMGHEKKIPVTVIDYD